MGAGSPIPRPRACRADSGWPSSPHPDPLPERGRGERAALILLSTSKGYGCRRRAAEPSRIGAQESHTFVPSADDADLWPYRIGRDIYSAGLSSDEALGNAMEREASGPEPTQVPDDDLQHTDSRPMVLDNRDSYDDALGPLE